MSDADKLRDLHTEQRVQFRALAARAAIEAESRRTEMLIGELLGPAEIGRPKVSDGDTLRDLHTEQRVQFRVLAAHPEIVEHSLTAGITARAKILPESD